MRPIALIALVSLSLLASACGAGTQDPENASDHHEGGGGEGMGHGDPAAAADAQASFEGAPPVGAHAICPVSHESFTVTADTQTSQHDGRTYAFCCPNCKRRFDAEPTQFVTR